MLHVNLSIIAMSLVGCFLYVCSMSALGRLLAECREQTSVLHTVPSASGTLRF